MRHGYSLGVAWLFAGCIFAQPQSALADSEVRASADVTADGGYSNNPYSEFGNDLGSAFVEINARPKIQLVNEYSVLSLTGVVDYKHYFRLYPDASDYRAALDYLGRPNSQLTTHANLSYDSSILGGLGDLTTPTDLSQPQPPPTTGPDLAFYGTRVRRQNFDAAGDVSYALSARSSVTANAFYDVARYSGLSSQSDYDGYGGGGGYSHQVSAHLHLGIQASIARYVYRGPLGNAQIYSLQGTFNDQFSSHWSLSGAIGGTYSDRTIGGKTTYVTGNALLCRTTTRATLCFTAAQAILPTGIYGTVATKTVGGSYSYLLSEHSKLLLSANYSHTSEPTPELASGNSYLSTILTFDRTVKKRIHFITTAQYRKVYGGIGSRPDDFGGTVGVSVRLGDYR